MRLMANVLSSEGVLCYDSTMHTQGEKKNRWVGGELPGVAMEKVSGCSITSARDS